MATTTFQCLWGIYFSLSLYFILSAASTPTSVYIVYLGLIKHNHDHLLTSKYHIQLLSNLFASKEDAKKSMLYSYKHSFSGFSAILNSTQATSLAKTEGVISVFKSKTMRLHTTRSWDFMGLTLDYMTPQATTPPQFPYGDNVIVGIFDTDLVKLALQWPIYCDVYSKYNTESCIPLALFGIKGYGRLRKHNHACAYKMQLFAKLHNELTKCAKTTYGFG